MAQHQNDVKAQSQHKPSIVRFRLPKRHKPGWLQWLDVLEGMTDQDLLDATQDKTRFRAMYDRFQKLVYPKTKNLYKLDLSRTELNLLQNKDVRVFWEDPVKFDFILSRAGQQRGVDTGRGISSWNGSKEQYERLHARHGYSDRVLAGRHRRYMKEFEKKAAAREHYSTQGCEITSCVTYILPIFQ